MINIREFGRKVSQLVKPYFLEVEEISEYNTEKVMQAFANHKVSEMMLTGTTGYGYDDIGRDTLDSIYAEIFKTESALVRIQFVNGTHAITTAMFGCLKQGDMMLSVTGAPYDTLMNTVTGDFYGSFKSYGIKYTQTEFKDGFDYKSIEQKLIKNKEITTIFVQRSKGYGDRITLSCEEISKLCQFVKNIKPDVCVLVDNCYGEFVERIEPTEVGADLVCGSLIKNIGGGQALTGGYIAGRKDLVENASYRLTAPGIGAECGATLNQNRSLYQGLFMAPHITSQAVKTAIFLAGAMEELGYDVNPKTSEKRLDIIQTIRFGEREPLLRFCEGIQSGSPVDSHVTPEPWAIPGYNDEVVMAAGAFVQGASIEISADAPMREPYICYVQGGLTYESGKLCVLKAVEKILDTKKPTV